MTKHIAILVYDVEHIDVEDLGPIQDWLLKQGIISTVLGAQGAAKPVEIIMFNPINSDA